MPRSLRDVIASHVGGVFINTRHFGLTVTYARGITPQIPALMEAGTFDVISTGSETVRETRDIIFEVAKLASLPDEYDVITAEGHTYSVVRDTNRNCFVYDDPENLTIRVFTLVKS